MGQKTNPIILRLGINKTWNSEYIENKNSELSVYTFKSLEIKSYIEKFLKNKGLLLHSFKINYSNSSLHIKISYFIPTTFKFKNKNNDILDFKNIEELNSKLEINKFNKGLKIFVGGKNRVISVFQCINKKFYELDTNQLTFFKTRLTLLRRFRNRKNIYFDESFDIISSSIINKNSAFMLGKFISDKLKKIKKHNSFLSALTKILKLLITANFSTIKGIKIKISGKLNRGRRSKTRVITIGTVPTQTFNLPLDYSQTTVTHNPNGSLGIKIWILGK